MKQRLLTVFFLALILTLAAFAPVLKEEIDHLVVKKITLQEGGAFFSSALDMDANAISNIGAAGTDFSASGGLTLAQGLTVSDGNVVIADFAQATAQGALTVTDGGTITATGSYQPLTAAGAVGATLGGCAASNAGQVTTFINAGGQTITITDTGTTVLGGNAALGQYDTLVVWCDGTRQIQIAKADN